MKCDKSVFSLFAGRYEQLLSLGLNETTQDSGTDTEPDVWQWTEIYRCGFVMSGNFWEF